MSTPVVFNQKLHAVRDDSTGRDRWQVAIEFEGTSITDPTRSENTIETVTPVYYGLTLPEASMLTYFNTVLIEQVAENAINEVALMVQDSVGQTDGGLASLYFSDDVLRTQLEQSIAGYIVSEINFRSKT